MKKPVDPKVKKALEDVRVARELKLKALLNTMKLGETVPMGEYAYIQSLGKSGYVYVIMDKLYHPVSVCHIPKQIKHGRQI